MRIPEAPTQPPHRALSAPKTPKPNLMVIKTLLPLNKEGETCLLVLLRDLLLICWITDQALLDQPEIWCPQEENEDADKSRNPGKLTRSLSFQEKKEGGRHGEATHGFINSLALTIPKERQS